MTTPTTITPEQLEAHKKWINGDADGTRLVLRYADLRGADLRYAVLRGADLAGAVLAGAVLQGAVLRGADLRYAVLRGADLTGAVLRDAVLQGAIGLPIAADAQERLRAVATAALQPNALEMETWHTCETTHCMAGWAIHLAGEPGRIMQKMLGPEVTGLLLLGSEAHRYFYKSNEEARQFLQGVIEND